MMVRPNIRNIPYGVNYEEYEITLMQSVILRILDLEIEPQPWG